MARTAITLTDVSAIAKAIVNDVLTAVDNVNGNYFVNDGRVMLAVENNSGGSLTITIDTPYTIDGLELTDSTITVDNGDTIVLGPFPARSYNQRGSYQNQVFVDWSTGTSVTVAALQY